MGFYRRRGAGSCPRITYFPGEYHYSYAKSDLRSPVIFDLVSNPSVHAIGFDTDGLNLKVDSLSYPLSTPPGRKLAILI